jgi:hypothetical protein
LTWEEAVGLQVLLVGRLRPELGVSGTHEGVAVADIRHHDAVQDAVTRLAGDATAVMIACAVADAPEVRRQLNLLAVALPHVRTLLEPVPGSPLAVAVTAALVGDVDGTRDPAVQLALLDQLRERSWSATWLPRVSKLADPAPTLLQHARGWLGGSGFLAVHSSPTGCPRVLTCTGTAVPAPGDTPAEGVLMVADSGAPDWVVPALSAAVGIGSRTDYETWRDPRDAFGVPVCAEVLIVPGDLDDPAALPDDTRECPGCGNRHGRRVCPYCRMTEPVPSGSRDADGTDSPDEPADATSAGGPAAPSSPDTEYQGADA